MHGICRKQTPSRAPSRAPRVRRNGVVAAMHQNASSMADARSSAMPRAAERPCPSNQAPELLYHPLTSPLSLPRSLASHASSRARSPLMPSASSCCCSRRLQLDRCCTQLAKPGAPARSRSSFVASWLGPASSAVAVRRRYAVAAATVVCGCAVSGRRGPSYALAGLG